MDISDSEKKWSTENHTVVAAEPADEETSVVNIELEYDPRINFAVQQNSVPVIRQLRVTNRSGTPLKDLTVTIHIEPDYAPDWSTKVQTLAPGASHTIDMIPLDLSPQKLAMLEERFGGTLRLTIMSGEETLLSQSHTLEFLAFNEWSGVASPPELLAAFVQPNHPATRNLLKNARVHFSALAGDSAFSGYQEKDPQRVYNMAKAIYQAIQSAGITYINPPASFEQTGQKIRTPDQLMDDQMGTCLDLSVIMAAVLEQAGLHPFIIAVPGHAFPGVWLFETCLPYPAVDDVLQIRKLAELDQLIVFDSSTMATEPRIGFEEAVRRGRSLLKTTENAVTIDIHAARDHRIRPLPMRNSGELRLASADSMVPSSQGAEKPFAPKPIDSEDSLASTESATDRLTRWKTKLLDLSLRNRLLNFKETKGTLKLLSHDLAKLEDALADGKPFTLMERPDLMDGMKDQRNAELHRQQTGEDALAVFLERQLGKHRFYTPYEADELRRRAIELHRNARLSLEESGTNTLYLALGFVYWRETVNSSKTYRAPILLLPVTLSRKAVTDPFTISLADSEPRINTTFLKMLETEYGIKDARLADLPEDDAGFDLPLVLRRYREAVLNLQGWEVREEAHLGLFSFTKYLMWLDLEERTGELKQNPVVEHLLERFDKVFQGVSEFPSAAELEKKWQPDQTFCVLDADSSQLAGVYAADHGQSFVMEGPPGTGKSQTIANIVAQMMANGKSVLFVSEKRAALEVVYRRLTEVGLKEFCLELHSNKANGQEVISQLGESLKARQSQEGKEWTDVTRQLSAKRESLNAYIEAAYRPRTFGENFHDAVVRLIGAVDSPKVQLAFGNADAVDQDRRHRLNECVRAYRVAAEALKGEPAKHPWNTVGLADWNPAESQGYHETVNRLAESAKHMAAVEQTARKHFLLPAVRGSKTELERLDTLCRLVKEAPGHSANLLATSDWATTKRDLDELQAHGDTYRGLRDDFGARFDYEAMRQLDFDNLLPKFRRWHAAFLLLAWFMLFFARRVVRKASLNGKLPANSQVLADLEACKRAMGEQDWLESRREIARGLVGPLWNASETDWQAVAGLVQWAESLRGELAWWDHAAPEKVDERRKAIVDMSGDRHAGLVASGSLGQELDAFRTHWTEYGKTYSELCRALALDERRAFGEDEATGYIETFWKRLGFWRKYPSHLEYWVRFRQAEKSLNEHGLAELGKAHRHGAFGTSMIEKVYSRSFYEWWIQELYKADPVLADFYSPSYEATIRKFRELDTKSFELARDAIRARLGQKVPHVASAPDSSEVGILRRELSKQRRHMRIRPLLEKLPTLLSTLKPCFLMSPLSVAQYLGPKIAKFDLVIFDEASQIPPWDAIGAIGRGKQVIVVGDSKQLPPTSFFQRGELDEEFEEDDLLTEDMESILSECVASNLPRHWLSWHYRSRHEHLIAFSNHHYYQNRLLTFPSSVDQDRKLGVKWRHVGEGYYDHGKSRTNKVEAERVVEEVVCRLRDPEEKSHSIGVVTFSKVQQKLVEDLLEQKRAEFPEIEPYFSEEVLEPVFVKNLENVQGDERDVIIFSICYGPDATGKVCMNFGPINKKGGERRLNVAITRARELLLVFSTLTPEMIDLSRTRMEGVQHMKTFLAYADRGPAVIAEAMNVGSLGDFDSPFEEAVFHVLTDLGWTVHSQVGCSGYRIDLAVADPDAPGSYLLGIECDGANYHSARSVRDRDRLRQQVLKRLGWTIHRIWSTDWWKDKAREVEKLNQALKDAVQYRRQWKMESASIAPAINHIVAKKEDSPETPLRYASRGVDARSSAIPASSSVSVAKSNAESEEHSSQPMRLPNQQTYQRARVSAQSSDFYDRSSTPAMQTVILQLLEKEAPIHCDALVTAIRQAWGFNRAGARIQERVAACVRALPSDKRPKLVGAFYWPANQDPAGYTFFRTPEASDPNPRPIQEITPEELSNAALALVEQYGTMSREDLLRSTANLFGISRLGTNVKDAMEQTLQKLAKSSRIHWDGDQVVKC